MTQSIWRVGWFWSRTNLRRRWTSYLMLIALVGAIGGLAIGSVVAAQRTSSSYNTFLASTNPSDLSITIAAPNVSSELAKLRYVKHVAIATYSVNAFLEGPHDTPDFAKPFADGDVTTSGSLKGEYYSIDKVAVVAGHMANPKKINQFVADPVAASDFGWHVGQSIPMYFYTDGQTEQSDFGTSKVKPTAVVTMHLVGLVVPNDDAYVDEIDSRPRLVIFTPATTRLVVNNGYHYNVYSLQLTGGVRDVPAVEREIIAALPAGTTYTFRENSVVQADVNHSLEPEAIALDVFALIAALAALIIAAGLIARNVRRDREEMTVLRALGASPSTIFVASSLGLSVSIAFSGLVAIAIAILLSPLSPIGPVRQEYPDRGFAFNGPVLGIGFGAVLVLLGAMTVAFVRQGQRRVTNTRRSSALPTHARAPRLVAALGLPVSAVVGSRFALEPGSDRDGAPVRSALIGAVLAVTIVVATLTFGSSLSALVSHPRLFGWNWSYAIYDDGNGVPPQAAKLLKSDPYVAAWSGDDFANAQINGLTVPIFLTTYRAAVTPPILSGHEVDGPNQIVLGAATIQELHKKVGDYVYASYGTPKDAPVYVSRTRVQIVGTASLPTLGGTLSQHPDLGVGAMIPVDIEPPAFRRYLHSPNESLDGYSVLLVRLRSGAPTVKARQSLEKIAKVGTVDLNATPVGQGETVLVLPPQYPAEIENYRTIGAIPDILALALALGAVAALALALISSVHRRRRDLALLRALGCTGRQLRATVAWQASIAGGVGVIVGTPLGIIVGRWLWDLFARSVYVVPDPAVPVLSLVVVAVCTMVLANVVAATPGRSAARTSTAQVLRGE
jgi:hypothetical protein